MNGSSPDDFLRRIQRPGGGVNLKPAREMGMTTIKVLNGPQAIAELEAATGLTLG